MSAAAATRRGARSVPRPRTETGGTRKLRGGGAEQEQTIAGDGTRFFGLRSCGPIAVSTSIISRFGLRFGSGVASRDEAGSATGSALPSIIFAQSPSRNHCLENGIAPNCLSVRHLGGAEDRSPEGGRRQAASDGILALSIVVELISTSSAPARDRSGRMQIEIQHGMFALPTTARQGVSHARA
jgi:hypothetical protein